MSVKYCSLYLFFYTKIDISFPQNKNIIAERKCNEVCKYIFFFSDKPEAFYEIFFGFAWEYSFQPEHYY